MAEIVPYIAEKMLLSRANILQHVQSAEAVTAVCTVKTAGKHRACKGCGLFVQYKHNCYHLDCNQMIFGSLRKA